MSLENFTCLCQWPQETAWKQSTTLGFVLHLSLHLNL